MLVTVDVQLFVSFTVCSFAVFYIKPCIVVVVFLLHLLFVVRRYVLICCGRSKLLVVAKRICLCILQHNEMIKSNT
jgi:hypothetical protein